MNICVHMYECMYDCLTDCLSVSFCRSVSQSAWTASMYVCIYLLLHACMYVLYNRWSRLIHKSRLYLLGANQNTLQTTLHLTTCRRHQEPNAELRTDWITERINSRRTEPQKPWASTSGASLCDWAAGRMGAQARQQQRASGSGRESLGLIRALKSLGHVWFSERRVWTPDATCPRWRQPCAEEGIKSARPGGHAYINIWMCANVLIHMHVYVWTHTRTYIHATHTTINTHTYQLPTNTHTLSLSRIQTTPKASDKPKCQYIKQTPFNTRKKASIEVMLQRQDHVVYSNSGRPWFPRNIFTRLLCVIMQQQHG